MILPNEIKLPLLLLLLPKKRVGQSCGLDIARSFTNGDPATNKESWLDQEGILFVVAVCGVGESLVVVVWV